MWQNRRKYADALVHMRIRQLAHRPRRAIPLSLLAAGIGARVPSGWRPLAAGAGVESAPSSGPRPPFHGDGVFRALGRERHFGEADFWTRREDGLLFLFNLHGFGELAAYAAGSPSPEGDQHWAAVLSDWLASCSRPAQPAWHPYPMSGRIVAWCAALSRDGWLDELRPALLTSLVRQTSLLRRSIEHDIGGNHVLRNAAALIVAGSCLEEEGALKRGLRQLDRELAAQILPDGGHEERSPCYHRLVLDDLDDVRAVLWRAGLDEPPRLDASIDRMRRWLGSVAGPGGDVPPLNDGWDGPPLEETSHEPVSDLAETGYLVLREGRHQALFDVGPLAPPHLPAHAHADALSVLMWVDGERLLVDCGSGSYSGPERARFRATSAHNTVEIDEADQCDLWAPFRAAYMPKVERRAVERLSNGAVIARAVHDGYARLDDPVLHDRTLVWLGRDGVVLIDRLRCKRPHQATSRLHFAESIDRPFESLPGGLALRSLTHRGEMTTRSGSRSPYLGRTVQIPIVEWAGQVASGEPFGWSITRPLVDVRLEGPEAIVERPGLPAIRLTVD